MEADLVAKSLNTELGLVAVAAVDAESVRGRPMRLVIVEHTNLIVSREA
jgi:hypothetical protein